jgi:hypothetical protein
MDNYNQRLTYIDILKGWAILCIVFLHFEKGVIPGWLNVWIGNFMISTFYFTSGWLAGIKPRDITVKELARKRWNTLGKPYIYFSILILLFDIVLWAAGHYDMKFIARELYKTITLRGIGTLWFLPALFGGEIIFRYLLNKKNTINVLFFLVISLVFIHIYYYFYFKYRNVNDITRMIEAPLYTFRNIISAWPIIGVAYLIAKTFGDILTHTEKYIILLLGITIIGLSIYINGGFCPISFGILSLLIKPTIGPLGLILIAYLMNSGIVVRFLSFWGVNSLVMMVTHYSILLVISQILDKAIFHESFSGIRTIMWFIITVIVEYPIVWIFTHKARWMLGKR